jgi:hypothetical protein
MFQSLLNSWRRRLFKKVGAYVENAQECAASSTGLFESLLSNQGRKAIQIKMARAVDAKVLVDALEEVSAAANART